ncbi:hypothetical protein BDZ45DRAFT_737156 [Acephala macrosclerotiorum]|nr:hypothetical protein BDZ45DRAFT_737156 [Acephala macrosclerotiorum]
MSNPHFKELGIFLCCSCDQDNHIDFNTNFPSQCSCEHDLCDGCGRVQAIYEPVEKQYRDDNIDDCYDESKGVRHLKFGVKDEDECEGGDVVGARDKDRDGEVAMKLERKNSGIAKLKSDEEGEGVGKSLSPTRLRMETRRMSERCESQ